MRQGRVVHSTRLRIESSTVTSFTETDSIVHSRRKKKISTSLSYLRKTTRERTQMSCDSQVSRYTGKVRPLSPSENMINALVGVYGILTMCNITKSL